MKLKSQIVGLPVFSIAEVAVLGEVEDLVINPDTSTVDYLIIQPEAWYMERRLISFKDVAGIGEDALTTETKANVVSITTVPAAVALISQEIEVVGSQVMTRKGRISGSVDEIAVDDESGKIIACRWVSGDGHTSGLFPSGMVITFGKGMLVVEDHFESELVDNASQVKKDVQSTLSAKQDEVLPVVEDPLQFFEDKQKQYLIGRTVTTDISTDNGEVIAENGDKVTQEMVDKAVAADKFVELTLNTRD